MPAAARISDLHTCPQSDGPKPHGGGPVVQGDTSVLIGFQPAARVGDQATCSGAPDTILKGEGTVLIGDRPAARMGDNTAHGGVIVAGCPTVRIGSTPQIDALRTDQPFCERCAADTAEAAAKRQDAPESPGKAAKPDKVKVDRGKAGRAKGKEKVGRGASRPKVGRAKAKVSHPKEKVGHNPEPGAPKGVDEGGHKKKR